MRSGGEAWKNSMRKGDKQFGLFLNSASTTIAAQLSHAGYDWLLVDTQHGPMNPETLCDFSIKLILPYQPRCPGAPFSKIISRKCFIAVPSPITGLIARVMCKSLRVPCLPVLSIASSQFWLNLHRLGPA
jgi:hypothetical protein